MAWGMRFALRLAGRRGLPAAAAHRLERLITILDPPSLPEELSAPRLLEQIRRDKKAREGAGSPEVRWVLPVDVGRGRWGVRVPAEEVASELEAFLAGH